MKTQAELKFDRIIKDGFHEILKPMGFKKKANNFYLQLKDLGQIINVQKSMWGDKNNIDFTINVGIFVPEYWQAYYNFNRDIPTYPTEPECLIRRRIGKLRNQHDTWYHLEEKTNEEDLISEMRMNLQHFILPYFAKINNRISLLKEIDTVDLSMTPLGKLIVYGEFSMRDKLESEYKKLLKKKHTPSFQETLKEYDENIKLIR